VILALSAGELISKSEKLWIAHKYQESNKILRKALATTPGNVEKAEIYWRTALNLYDMAEGMSGKAHQARHDNYTRMGGLSKKCMALAPKMPECYLFYATGMSRQATQKGILNSLEKALEIEKNYLKVIELEATYRTERGELNILGDAYCRLGTFYRLLPEWSEIKRLYKIKGDKKKSIDMLRKAVEIEPGRIEYAKELGISLVCYGESTNNRQVVDEGIMWLKKIRKLKVLKPTDKIDKKHAKMILADLEMACGYSRDAQQDVSRESFEKKKK